MDKSNKNIIFRSVCLICFIVFVSVAVVYFTLDIETLYNINLFKYSSIFAAILVLCIGLFFDGTRLKHLLQISNEYISFREMIYVVFSNYFLALLTPGATGGAVAQVMFLKKAGVSVGKATLIVFVRTILSILFLIFMLPLVFYYDDRSLPYYSASTIFFIFLALTIISFYIVWLFTTDYPRMWFVMFTKRMGPSRRHYLFRWFKELRVSINLFAHNPFIMIRVFIESGLSLLFIYSVVPMLFFGLGVEFDFLTIMSRMIILNLILYFTPTPGGAGVAEAGFVLLFQGLLPKGTVGIMAVLWRIIVEYLPFLVGAYFSISVFKSDVLRLLKNVSNERSK